MQATGSNTIVCDDVYVPESHTLALSDIREGKTPGGKLHSHPIYPRAVDQLRATDVYDADAGRCTGAYETFREWTKTGAPAGVAPQLPNSPVSRCAWRGPPPISMPPSFSSPRHRCCASAGPAI